MGWLKDAADDLYAEYYLYRADTLLARADWQATWGYVGDEEWALAETYGVYGCDDFAAATQHIPGNPPWHDGVAEMLKDLFYWLEDNWPSNGEPEPITMNDIINAMYNSTQLEYHYFVGYVDAYRANMWNLPFYESWHAMLTRHFAT